MNFGEGKLLRHVREVRIVSKKPKLKFHETDKSEKVTCTENGQISVTEDPPNP